jgi:amidohydrolase
VPTIGPSRSAAPGGHGGAKPHLATDPTIVQAHFVLAAQNIIGRNVPPLESAVISVGHIAAGAIGSPNIIPTEVIVAGTARTFSPATRSVLEGRLREVAEGLAAIQGCSCQFAYERATPPLFCASEQTDIMAAVAVAMVGEEMVNTSIPLTMGGEDFAFMAEQRPSSMIMIGNGVNADDGSFANLHTPIYDFNDDILCLGATYWVKLVHMELA